MGESETATSAGKPSNPITVVLCDDHELFRHGLAEMLTTAEDIRIVGAGNTHERAVAVISETGPDVVLLDLAMPNGQAETALRKMLSLPHPPRVVIVTMYDEPRFVRRFIGMGASTYLPKSASLEELLTTVRRAAANLNSPPGEDEARIVSQDGLEALDERADRLSKRQVEILLQAARGLSNQQIATTLHLCEATVKRRLGNT